VGTYYRRLGVPVTEVWIETGTYRGDSIAAALREGYPCIRSVEFLAEWAKQAQARFGTQRNVTIVQGSSPERLPELIEAGRSTTFWLDAHYQGGPASEQDPRYGECPLLAELAVIRGTPWARLPILAIDDAHMFFADTLPAGFTAAHWPSLEQIRAALLPGYQVDIENNVVWAIPHSERLPGTGENHGVRDFL
jgi:hypothetical protein